MWPEVRIIAGIEASTMTSEGTCRLVMPRSESTIASAGPSASPARTAALIAVALGQRLDGGQEGAQAVVGADARRPGSASPYSLEQRREEGLHDVAEDDRVGDLHHRGLQVHREQHVLGLGPGDLLGRGTRAARRRRMTVRVDDLAGEHGRRLLEHGDRAVGGDVLDAQDVVGRAATTDFSLERKSSAPMVATLVLDVGDQAPIECGWLRA